MTTPRRAGYYMPAEWLPHDQTWMAWPVRSSLWGDRIDAARHAYADVAKTIARFEPVTMVVPEHLASSARSMLGENIQLMVADIDDSWIRDSGPTFLIGGCAGCLAGADWQFNSWGRKYLPFDQDARLATKVLDEAGAHRFEAPFVLEGGAIHVDGNGTLITTEECLLNPNRNPSLSRAEVEENLREWLSIDQVIWLGQGLVDDLTDGHVDNIAAFVRPGVVALATCADPADEFYRRTQDNIKRLRAAKDAKGRELEIIEIPNPASIEMHGNERLPMSYLNYYLCNGAVILPVFGEPEDEAAKNIIQKMYPEREVVPVDGRPITYGGGCVHCITQQQPSTEGFGNEGCGKEGGL